MKRQGLFGVVLLVVFALLLLGSQKSTAQEGDTLDRHKTVEIRTVQYVWNLVSNSDGRVICQLIIEHEGTPTTEETLSICMGEIYPPEDTPAPTAEDSPEPTSTSTPLPSAATATPAPTEEPFTLENFFLTVSYRFIASREITRTVKIPLPDIVVHLSASDQPGNHFATITAYEPVYGYKITEIRGVLNGLEFSCAYHRCDVPISGDSVLDFWAVSSYGDESRHYAATVREVLKPEGKRLEITYVDAIATFSDSCSQIWGTTLYQAPDWALFPASPEELNTKKQYQFLAAKLITAGIVKASGCPGGGLYYEGAPNACGVEAATEAVIEWQNQFDVAIWDAARKTGIPPRLIKAIIEQETQFWPGNSRLANYEYGLGQLSQAGADVVLRWDNDLFADICSGLLYNCGIAYGQMPSWLQATLRGGLLKSMNAECATCNYGIDLAKAHESIPIFARTVRANCYQVNHMMRLKSLKASYEDMWRFTLLSYHSGYQCLDNALYLADYNDLDINWSSVSPLVKCYGGAEYVNNVMKSLQEFKVSQLVLPEETPVM
ncbi:MAG TPA: hypothetical protein VEC99_02115, partial [Clostridia bacterium]|nr:hypothetical protein [Clostridia bacterium]